MIRQGERLALATATSGNRKIGACATTYAAQTSCPPSCVFKDGGGCYAEAGTIGKFVTEPLNATVREGDGPMAVALAEARAISALEPLYPGQPMRLHTVGDCATVPAAMLVADACAIWHRRGGGPVWTYTHAWRDVPRDAWRGTRGDVTIHVLASCETLRDVVEAHERGYATSIVVPEFPSEGGKRYAVPRDDTFDWPDVVSVLPCPAQTRDRTCDECRLCMDSDRLLATKMTIGFEVHGTPLTTKLAHKALADPDDPTRRLTSRDHALAYRDEYGEWPTVRELQRLAGVTSASAWEMLRRLDAERASDDQARIAS